MTDNTEKQRATLPWRWRIALARIVCTVVLGLAGFVWAGWLLVTGHDWEAIFLMIAILACGRLLAGGLYGYKG